DFNNILSAILGFSELAMRSTEPDSTIRGDLEEVYNAGQRAKELVKQILTFARQTEEERQPLQFSSIIKEVAKFLRSSIPTSVDMVVDINSRGIILGNPTRVHQVVMNLCTNAVQAMEDDKGKLRISVQDIVLDSDGENRLLKLPEGEYIQVRVADNGKGILPQHLDMIFEPYFTTKEMDKGTGLGLSLVYGIIESYGGKITVDSKPGQGSVFTFYLPVVSSGTNEYTYEPEELPRGSGRILVVDDEASIAKLMKKMLESLGYQVFTRTSSVEALALFRSKPNDIDLVLTDMTMPDMTGDELGAEISAIRPDIPIILCTGYSRKIAGKPVGKHIRKVINKPVDRSELAVLVKELM
ncbi:MAG TPA: PAS domain S-box protein, partial [Desulfobacteraceae bacterium]|nr:PAS domain S-box protein [Desulfobacteraceae bacterium]